MEVELNTRNLGIERWLRNSFQRAVCALSSSGALILWRKPRVCAVSAFTLGGLLQCLPGRVEPGRRPLTASSQNDYVGVRPREPATRPRSRYPIAPQSQRMDGRNLLGIGKSHHARHGVISPSSQDVMGPCGMGRPVLIQVLRRDAPDEYPMEGSQAEADVASRRACVHQRLRRCLRLSTLFGCRACQILVAGRYVSFKTTITNDGRPRRRLGARAPLASRNKRFGPVPQPR
jgi:hypothetical protein